uniref:Venom protein family 11 protein 2 n=1 Tax=Pristhesancus plagipennis TaxID=1955184 RepID=A0A2K8JLL0_PRIPG|nr:venom protein family 11 protein 2 [Pristhesancus plagipennis]
MRSILVIISLSLAAQAAISNSDVSEMVNKLQSSIDKLEEIEGKINGNIKKFTAELLAHTEEDNGADGKNCFLNLLQEYKQKVNIMIDESIGGYILSSRSLINDIKSSRLDESEMEHTKHMLSKEGSYFQQMKNSIRFMLDRIVADEKEFHDTVHKQCCKHD